MHHVFVNKKLFSSCGINVSYFCQRESFLKLWYQCIMCSTTRKLFKSCGVNASCFCQQESSSKVVVSMHHVFVNKKAVYKLQYQCIVFVNKKAVYKLWYQCIMCLLTRKLFTSCGVDASCVCQQESSLKVVMSTHYVFVNKKAV